MRVLLATFLLALAISAGNAAAQGVAGLNMKYDAPFRARPDIEKAVVGILQEQIRQEILGVRAFSAGASGDITEVTIIQTQYRQNAEFDLDSAAKGALENARRFPGVTQGRESTIRTKISGREARLVSFDATGPNGRFALEAMLAHDVKTNTAWVIQFSVGRRYSPNLEMYRERARTILASTTIAE